MVEEYKVESQRGLKRLRTAIKECRRRLEPFRRNRTYAIKQFVGAHYSDDAADAKVPVNLLKLAVDIYTRQLAANNPQVFITTPHQELRPTAYNLGLAINHLLQDEINFVETLQRGVIDAMFSIGIFKMGMNYSKKVEVGGYSHDVGQVFIDNVDLDNWFHDMSVNRIEEAQFMGDRYRLPYDQAIDCGLYDEKLLKKAGPTPKEEERINGEERVEELSQGQQTYADEYVDHISLIDVWLPAEGKIITIAEHPLGVGEDDKPLAEREWDGPEMGPYHYLAFTPVPNNIMPTPPANHLIDLHELVNALMRKIGRQGQRQKTIGLVMPGGGQDAQRIKEAQDGQLIKTSNPKNIGEMKFGGVDGLTFAFMLQSKDLFSWLSGNLDSLGGLSPQAQTLGQDELLAASSSKMIEQMQAKVVHVTKGICRDVAWYLMYDEAIEIPMVKRIPGTDISLPVTWDAESREGDYLDYNIQINPFSLQPQTPQQKFQSLVNIFQTVIAPLMPLLQQQGIGVDMMQFMNDLSEYGNLPELKSILRSQAPMMDQQGPVGQAPRQAAMTTRKNIRINRPGAGRMDKDQQLINSLMGVGQQGSEGAGMFRAIS